MSTFVGRYPSILWYLKFIRPAQREVEWQESLARGQQVSGDQEWSAMPTYVYEVVNANGEPGERFEIVQAMSDEPLSQHPETGQPVRRVFVPFHVAGKYAPLKTDRNLSDNKKLERLGFTKYVKSADGQYDRVFGKEGPKELKRPKS